MRSDICMRPHSPAHTHAYAHTCKVRMMFIDGVCLNASDCEKLSVRSPRSAAAAGRRDAFLLLGEKSAHSTPSSPEGAWTRLVRSGILLVLLHTRVHTAVSVLFIHVAAAAGFSSRSPSAPSLSLHRTLTPPDSFLHLSVSAAAAAE